jgi:hypothetical protein
MLIYISVIVLAESRAVRIGDYTASGMEAEF